MPTSVASDQSPFTTEKRRTRLANPGLYLVYKYHEYKRQQKEERMKKITERELDKLNVKIDAILATLDNTENHGRHADSNTVTDFDCVVCLSSRTTVETLPCGHRVVCRRCFIKTIQTAATDRCLPLRCVVCRRKILKLKRNALSVPPKLKTIPKP